ncbi:sodium-dependent glucose transporter 1-like [Argopecten irradians]|uniref:sodium-dependent glucose transporter 1-like n=1 Tax=Argopecten irradians TaxID=31199 RepID=UPI00371E3DC0
MVGIHALHGILQSILNVGITTASIQIWGTDSRGRTYVFILYAFLEISCAVAPIGTAPFLHEKEITNEVANISNTPIQTGTCCSGDETFVNDTRSPSRYPQTDSRLYIAYSISAGMAVAVAVPFLIVYLKTGVEDSTGPQTFKKSTFLDKTSPVSNYLQFINIGLFSGIYTVMEVCYPQYLTVFCLRYLDWTKTSAAMVTSVLSFSRLGGKFVGIVLVRVMKAHTILLVVSLLDTFGFVCLNISVYTFDDIGVWASACITGLGTSIMWPTALSWINSNLIAVSGKVSSYLLVIAYLFALITPIALGHLMQEVSLLWFCYISLMASVVIVANVICMIIHTKRHDKGGHVYEAEIYTIESVNKKEAQSEVTRL